MAKIDGCADCHTPTVQVEEVKGMGLAGGQPFRGPWGNVASANITPDDTGIRNYTEDFFLLVLRIGVVNGQHLNTVMPVLAYQNLNDTDLKAVYSYLRSVPAVQHRVDNSLTPTDCKVCKQRHGGGDKNSAV